MLYEVITPFMPIKTKELLDLMNEEFDLEIRGNDLKTPKVIFTKVSDEDISQMKEKLLAETKGEEKSTKKEKTTKVESGEKMEMIDIDYFGKVELRVGKILA